MNQHLHANVLLIICHLALQAKFLPPQTKKFTVIFLAKGIFLGVSLKHIKSQGRFPQIKEMPRKPTRDRRVLRPLPFTFSQFGRTMSHLAFASMAKSQIHELKFHRSSPSSIRGHELSKHTLEEKSELSKSSDEDLEEKSELSLSSDEESEETSELSESSDEEVSEGVIQADFAFFDPKPNDFHGVKILLQTFLDDTEWNLSGFVDLILEQTTVGTVIKIEDAEDDGLFSFVTVLNLARYKDHQCIKELKEYLLKVCGKDLRGNLRLLLGEQAQDVGLLVSQRVVNLPPQLLPPLYDALFDEVSWATEDEPTKELRNYFRFKFYLMVSRIYKLKNADQKKSSSSSDEEIIYVKPEDEIFHKLSSWSFSFPLHTQPPAAQELKNYRLMGLVMAVEAEKVSRFRQELKSLINES